MIGDSMQARQRDASGSPIKTTRRPEVFLQHGTSCIRRFESKQHSFDVSLFLILMKINDVGLFVIRF
jgi:hypothetical protein